MDETKGDSRELEISGNVNKISANGKILVTVLPVGYFTEPNYLKLFSNYQL